MVLADETSPMYGGALGAARGRLHTRAPAPPRGLPHRRRDRLRRVRRRHAGGQALFNKTAFLEQLTQEWLPTLGVSHLLEAPARAPSTWAAAPAGRASRSRGPTPASRCSAFDSDEASVMDARANAAEAGRR